MVSRRQWLIIKWIVDLDVMEQGLNQALVRAVEELVVDLDSKHFDKAR